MPDCVEIGWRLRKEFWGKGYATEAARKWLDIGFGEYDLKEIISFTAQQNIKSQEVMKRKKKVPSYFYFFYLKNEFAKEKI